MRKLTTLLAILHFSFFTYASSVWHSPTIGSDINYKITDSSKPAKDKNGKLMTVVYLENLSCEKIGQNTNAEDVAWLLNEGYRVIELDYEHHENAVSPYINKDIIAINTELNKGTFCGSSNISNDRAYILFEGYRLQRDVVYYKDDPTIYNYPDAYAKTEGDNMYMDIVYPANPSRKVPTLLSFSYSNSFSGNVHKRMFLGYTWAMFNDSFVEGAPAVGCAWAIADHPKYCDWGRGNRPGGVQKEYGAIEVCPDAQSKVDAAISTITAHADNMGLNKDIAMYGFSRGSTAASLALCNANVKCSFLGPGVFDYAKMATTSNEYKHMDVYVNYTVTKGIFSTKDEAWAAQRSPIFDPLNNIGDRCGGLFLFYNTDDDPNYDTQMKNLTALLDRSGVPYEMMKNYGSGHSVPQTTEQLDIMYNYLKTHCIPETASINSPSLREGTMWGTYRWGPLLIADGKKYIVR